MSHPDDEPALIETDLFEEPADFFKPPPKPTVQVFERDGAYVQPGEPTRLTLNLLGHSPLYGHLLWNAGKATTNYVDRRRDDLVRGKTLLELGAGAGLPSLVAALAAKRVVITDYPDPDLLQNIERNVKEAGIPESAASKIAVAGYIWGNEVESLFAHNNGEHFDLLILSDLIFNFTEHTKLLQSALWAVKPDTGRVLVVYTPHRPKWYHKDQEFFARAQEEFGFTIEDSFELDGEPMWVEDESTKKLRGKVFGYLLAPPPNK